MYKHYSQRAVATIVIPILFTALSTVMVVLRIMGRRIKRVSLWLDDYVMIASLVRCAGKNLRSCRIDFTTGFCISNDGTHSCQWVSKESFAFGMSFSKHGRCHQSGSRTSCTRPLPGYSCPPSQGGTLRIFGPVAEIV